MERETFHFSYSAAHQEEIKKIRDKYLPTQDNKLEQLRKLDASVTKKGTTAALLVGILGTLILGTGMSLSLAWGNDLLLPGILIGSFGILILALAYPLYAHITAKQREKLAPEILRLTDELLK